MKSFAKAFVEMAILPAGIVPMGVGVSTKSTHGYRFGYKTLPTGMGVSMSLHPLVLKIQRIPILVTIKLAGVDTSRYRT